MNLNIYLEDELDKQLALYASKFHCKKNTIVRKALKDWLSRHLERSWPKSIMEFEGIKDFPSIEELRQNIIEPKEDLF